MAPKRVGILGFEGVVAIDLAGPAQVFDGAQISDEKGNQQPGYEVLTIGLSNRPFATDTGMVIKPGKTVKNAPSLDTLIIPGGKVLARDPRLAGAVAKFVLERAGKTRRIASICTGAFGLAETGLLSGHNVTTHWRFARELADRFPDLRVQDDTIFIKAGSLYTSAGATAGIDLSLHLVEEDYGSAVALSVARDLVVYLKRSGGQQQYSEPLQFQTQSIDRFAELPTWMIGHLNENLSVEALAARACLCARHFGRRFKMVFGHSPADFVEKLRIDEARHRLSNGVDNIENIAASVGFKSADAFRRAFERRLGIKPKEFRQRFQSSRKVLVNVAKRSVRVKRAGNSSSSMPRKVAA